MQILYSRKEEISNGAFAVFASLGNGKLAQHQGPKNFDLFTEEQADKLVEKINETKIIDPSYWIFDNGDPYKEIRNLEEEYYARMTGE
ncbi:hypothetical protein EVB81_042 [Rhizobium phage RHph_I46]|uniref:Uncharacterized protein n=1 Tax=Rhizobium phage RHph_I1_9 TaxID=2509729 RepID=A0A7S5UZK2_9CAUD|nr:hypothetical protein PP936_gp041 [Rhizobium phage RHph_I1_9]QIG69611.1 hypothetical protein EVB81_042 [Rhizobium phage RHph_I46]QIG70892.1 hypothetical protein EVB92_042 [Rhizobium phage RHph_I9]QIG73478.1 hypothetical protein EVC04_041 [Rhizobium phage RHph_I1_9]QIG76231.1 hypothetical protein EVC25_042 [Rhizobium phage RHph_I34]